MQRIFYRILRGLFVQLLAFGPIAFASQGPAPTYSGQALTMLSDGRILATGGVNTSGNFVNEAYVVGVSGEVTKLPVGLLVARAWHSATALPDGTVLILGGKDSSGQYVSTMEIFDPKADRFTSWTGLPLVPRSNHTATVLTDGRLVIIGGTTEGGVWPNDIQFWDFRSGGIEAFDIGPIVKRAGQTATLMSDGRVLLDGGTDIHGAPVSSSEIFDPASHTFTLASDNAQQGVTASSSLVLSGSIPTDGTAAFPIHQMLALRFSRPIDVRTATDSRIRLRDSGQSEVPGTIACAESGRLVFFAPSSPLEPGSDYMLSVDGIIDSHGDSAASTTVHFHTTADTDDGAADGWIPDASALAGNWGTQTGLSKWQELPPLKAHSGETGLAGQVLGLSGKPLAHVTLQIENQKTRSDETGRFLLPDISPGHHVLVIDGTTADRPNATYGLYEAGVDIKANITNVLNYTVWMTKLDTDNAVTIASPTSEDTIITTPRIPGLELHLPANTVIRDLAGNAVNKLTITPIPLDKPPFPLPPGVQVPIYFTIQPGGSEIDVQSGAAGIKGAQLYYPNTYKKRPGTLYNFWNYDADSKGWYIYGQGQVSSDWNHIVPDSDVVLYELTGAMVGGAGAEPKYSPGDDQDGDPVDLSTGEFVYQKTDLTVADTVPISLSHTYISNDHYQRPFGIGTTDNYDMFLVGDTLPYTYMDLILPNGSRIHFVNTNTESRTYGDSEYVSTSTQGPWYGATIMWYSVQWGLTTRDGTTYYFPDSQYDNDQVRQALTGFSPLHGGMVTLTRNSNGYLTKITSPNGRFISLQYDSSNRITQATDNANRTVIYTYDSGGRLWTVTDAKGGVTTFTYNSNDQMVTIQDARGITYLTNQYDGSGRVLQQTLADGTYQFNWTPSSNISQSWVSSGLPVNRYNSAEYEGLTGLISQVKVTDPRGYVRQVTFNNYGMKTSDVFAMGQPEQQTFSYQYYADNLLKSMTDPLSRTTAFDYDGVGHLTQLTRLSGTANPVTSTFSYAAPVGQLQWATDPLGNTTYYRYDSNQSPQQIMDPLGHVQNLVYNTSGQLTSVTDGMNNTTSFGYTGGDLTSITDPLGNQTTLARDQIGRLTGITDAQGHQTQYVLDNLDQITSITDALQNNTSFVYDANGNLQTVTDALTHSTNFTYDNMDRLHTRTDALQRQESYTYDHGGNLATFTDRKGQQSAYTFDGIGRPTSVVFGVGQGVSNISFSYDGGNRMTQAVDSAYGTLTRGFDQLDHLTSESGPQGSIAYSYDNVGRRTSMQVAGQPQVIYAWDNADRLSSITQGTNTVGFVYDNANRRSTLTLPNGISANYSYDADSHITGISYSLGGNPAGDISYSYDTLGHRTGMSGSLATMNLPLPITSTTYDAANELINLNGGTISYDANGNTTSDGIHNYAWDARNQLASIDNGGAASFAYDPFGRRTFKAIGGSGTNFLYDGSNAVQELSGSSPIANTLIGGIDERFLRTDATGTLSYLSDTLGSTLALSDSNGINQVQYGYDPFGGTTQSGASTTNSYAYTGRELDTAGLYYYRARYYTPTSGRFLSEDSLRFLGGDANLYAYASDSPINNSDPTGNCPWCIGAAFGFGTDLTMQLIHNHGNWHCIDGGRLLVATGLGAVTGGLGGEGLNLGLSGLSNATKGGIGEGLSLAKNFLSGSSLVGTQVSGENLGLSTVFDSVWQSFRGTTYYVESKFGTSGLTAAQQAAQNALGSAYQVEKWTYPFFGNAGGAAGGALGGLVGGQMSGRACGCQQ